MKLWTINWLSALTLMAPPVLGAMQLESLSGAQALELVDQRQP